MFGLDYGCGWCKEFPGTEEDNNKRTQVSGDLSKQRPAPAHHCTATTHSFYTAQYDIYHRHCYCNGNCKGRLMIILKVGVCDKLVM